MARLPGQPHTHAFDAARRETATVLARLALPGDTVLLRCAAAQGAALGFKPGALPEGVTLRPAAEDGGGDGEGGGWTLAAFWVQQPPCYLLTMAKGGKAAHEALLDALLACAPPGEADDGAAAGSDGGGGSWPASPVLSARGGGGGTSSRGSSKPSSPAHSGGSRSPRRNSPRRSPRPAGPLQQVPREPLLGEGEWPVAGALRTDGFSGFAQRAVERCVDEGRCTFAATGASWMPQVRGLGVLGG